MHIVIFPVSHFVVSLSLLFIFLDQASFLNHSFVGNKLNDDDAQHKLNFLKFCFDRLTNQFGFFLSCFII